MSTTHHLKIVSLSPDDYLRREEASPRKHEYLAGRVYAMVGGHYSHNLIASNVLIELGSQLRGSDCRALNSDTKIKIDISNQTRFYYPDASVVCGDHIRTGLFQDQPSVVVEVMSESTRRIDETEKKDAYLAIPSLAAFLLVEQNFIGIIEYRRCGERFERKVYSAVTDIIDLPMIGCRLPVTAIYDAVPFPTPPHSAEHGAGHDDA